MKKISLIVILAAITIIGFGFIKRNPTEIKTVNLAPGTGTNIGDKAPELNFNNVDGKPIALSSLKGYYVLIDFWASWCGPCRMENPNVVNTFNQYKSKKFNNAKGLKIYSVSLDKDLERWKTAIAKDQLNWPEHVSDLKGWQSAAAAIYGVNSIPANYLIDGNGIIIAKNLRGPQLDAELAKIVAK